MLKTNRQNYIHIYMDLSDEILYFHSTSNPYPLGKSLIDFIYMDLELSRGIRQMFAACIRFFHCGTIHRLKIYLRRRKERVLV